MTQQYAPVSIPYKETRGHSTVGGYLLLHRNWLLTVSIVQLIQQICIHNSVQAACYISPHVAVWTCLSCWAARGVWTTFPSGPHAASGRPFLAGRTQHLDVPFLAGQQKCWARFLSLLFFYISITTLIKDQFYDWSTYWINPRKSKLKSS